MHFFAFYKTNYLNTIHSNHHLIVLINSMLPSGFEPESKPREGLMIDRNKK